MRLIAKIAVAISFLLSLNVFAIEPEVEVQKMLESDSIGDPSARIVLASNHAMLLVPKSRQANRHRIAYQLDADALEVATNWYIQPPPRDKCSEVVCDVLVVFRVVATTEGTGVPSWEAPLGREIKILPTAIERPINYHLTKERGKWVINRIPPPYISPQALREFFQKELASAELLTTTASGDFRAEKNKEIIRGWRLRQLELLRKVPIGG